MSGFSGTGTSYPIFSVVEAMVVVVFKVIMEVVVVVVVGFGGKVKGFSGTGISYPTFSVVVVVEVVGVVIKVNGAVVVVLVGAVVDVAVVLGGKVSGFSGTGISYPTFSVVVVVVDVKVFGMVIVVVGAVVVVLEGPVVVVAVVLGGKVSGFSGTGNS